MQPLRYPTDELQIGLVRTLLFRTVLLWFSILVKQNSPLLQDFDDFLEEFTNTFGETNNARTVATKICSLQQRSRAASIYVVEFWQFVCNVDWDNNALISVFQ